MVMRFFIIPMAFLFTVTFSLFTKMYYTGKENVILTGSFESKNSFISYVNINESPYIVKQKKDATKQIALVRDALAAYIAQDLGIAHSVQIISAQDYIQGKKYRNLPAALLTLASGKMIQDLHDNRYGELCLKQRFPACNSSPGRWLTETIIYQMTWHWQLPLIIALDLFLSNPDRHRGNFFYDQTTDRFCLIDMDNIFRWDLPTLARKKLDIMVNVDKKKFSRKEIKALIKVRDTLTLLLKKYTPDKIIAHLHLFAQQVGYSDDDIINNKKIAKKIASHEKMIVKSRASTHELIKVLDKIINSFHK
jgi:hypothetical protein